MRFARSTRVSGVFFALAISALLAACGGGTGGNDLPPIGKGSSSTPSPSPTPTANVSGTVVDYASDSPLANVQIAIANWSPGSSPTPTATTDPSGKFSFTTVPGTYMLVVGSNGASDTRATLHEQITLNAGSNVLAAATPRPDPDVTPLPSQNAGALRLMMLSTVQQDCLTAANQGRAQRSLPLLVPDEYLEEDAVADAAEEAAQNTDTPSPLFGYSQPFGSVAGMTTSADFSSCSSWTGPAYSYVSGSPPFGSATSPSNIWYGADFVPNPAQQYGTFGAQLWQGDPR